MNENLNLIHGDCLEQLKLIPDDSIDSIVTDPPYGLKFMGKTWDYDVPTVEIWVECLRVLKPGGHLLAFSGTRTMHRMATNIETAGFELRDNILNLISSDTFVERFITSLNEEQKQAFAQMVSESSYGGMLAWVYGTGFPKSHNLDGEWKGWGTALKPAFEPIIFARKPFSGTVCENVKQYGTGAINIDDSRVPVNPDVDGSQLRAIHKSARDGSDGWGMYSKGPITSQAVNVEGRFPANVIHDGSIEVLSYFPDALGQQGVMKASGKQRQSNGIYGGMGPIPDRIPRSESNKSAARFFYCAKASRTDRHEGMGEILPQLKHGSTLRDAENLTEKKGNHHPTVKPTALMRYLCRLVTPKNGLILDPFMGSGSTGKAALLENFRFIGIECEVEYFNISLKRCNFVSEPKAVKINEQQDLFSEAI